MKFLNLFLLFAFVVLTRGEDETTAAPAEKPAESQAVHARDLIKQNKAEVIKKINEKGGDVKEDDEVVSTGLKTYNDKDVPGLSYFVRVKVGGQHWHVRVVENEGKSTIMAVQGPKLPKDPLVYFE